MSQSGRSSTIDICKAFAIILMVLGHAECHPLMSFLYEFHMPVFFICAGYFFNLKYLNDEATYVKKRIKGLYWPFLKWALFFLCIHNLLFDIGILNEVHGNAAGGVTHPYTWAQFQQKVWSCVFNMSGYDEFLTGAFWFFRALFTSSIAFLLLYKLFYKIPYLRNHNVLVTILIALLGLGMALWHSASRLNVTGLSQNGYRDLMALFFFAVGFLFRQHQQLLNIRWWGAAICLAIVIVASEFFPSCMVVRATVEQCLRLPIPAIAGFLMTYWLSEKIASHDNPFSRLMAYCGRNTLPVYVFHIISFKIVSLIKIWYYGLEWGYIGCHMVVQHNTDDLFWLPYTIVAIVVPLGWNHCYNKLKDNILRART